MLREGHVANCSQAWSERHPHILRLSFEEKESLQVITRKTCFNGWLLSYEDLKDEMVFASWFLLT